MKSITEIIDIDGEGDELGIFEIDLSATELGPSSSAMTKAIDLLEVIVRDALVVLEAVIDEDNEIDMDDDALSVSDEDGDLDGSLDSELDLLGVCDGVSVDDTLIEEVGVSVFDEDDDAVLVAVILPVFDEVPLGVLVMDDDGVLVDESVLDVDGVSDDDEDADEEALGELEELGE